MNAGQLYAGEFYAWKRSPPKGRIPLDAMKVRLRHTEQRKRSYDKNRHTVAAVTVVDSGKELDVPAREIIMFWDEYELERDHLLAERLEAEKKSRRVSLRKSVLEGMINWKLHERQMPIVIHLDYTQRTAYIDSVSALIDWLQISEEEIATAIDRQMEEIYGEKEETP